MPERTVMGAEELARVREVAAGLREVFLAHLTLIGETPAPTFEEGARMNALLDRFAQGGWQQCSLDAGGNVTATLAGREAGPAVLLAAHADTIVEEDKDQTLEIGGRQVIGPFVGDNSLALAALATLPAVLEQAGLAPRYSLHALAAARILGRGNLEGVRQYLAAPRPAVQAAICLEGVALGRLNYTSMGMLRGEIRCRLPDDYDWAQFGTTGTIIPMSDIVGRISRIPVPRRPLTMIIMGSLHGGIAYNNIARETTLCFEARSESSDILRQLREQIEDIAEDIAGQSGVRVAFEAVAVREPGGLDIGHPLVRTARTVLQGLGLTPQFYATTSMMSAFRDAGIPAITLGVTTGCRKGELDEIDEAVDIDPIAAGLAQIAGVVAALDAGGPV
jgi:acetylornithine deacetylase/succinyl-diaminopimelate desuccinylase-like protein